VPRGGSRLAAAEGMCGGGRVLRRWQRHEGELPEMAIKN